MQKSFTLLIVLILIGAGIYASKDRPTTAQSATDVAAHASTSAARGLLADCHYLLKDYDRITYETNQLQQNFDKFESQLASDKCRANSNRANEWSKNTLFTLDGYLRTINKRYEHCVCEAGKIELTPELEILLNRIQHANTVVRNQILTLKTRVTVLQNRLQANLI